MLDMVHFSALSLGMVHHMPVIDLKLGLVSISSRPDTKPTFQLACDIRVKRSGSILGCAKES